MLLKTVLFMFLATAACAGPVNLETEAILQICNTQNATDKVEQVKILMDEYKECEPRTIDFTQLATDFNKARSGTVDEIARKNCAKAAQSNTCIGKKYTAAALCAKHDPKDILSVLGDSRRITDYMCYEEDGRTRLAKFVDDGGIRCLTSRIIDFRQCGQPILIDINTALDNFRRCVINILKSCSEPAAIRVESMYDYVHNGPPSSSNNQL